MGTCFCYKDNNLLVFDYNEEKSHIIAISKCCLQKNYASGDGIVLSMLENLVQRHLHQSINRLREAMYVLCVCRKQAEVSTQTANFKS